MNIFLLIIALFIIKNNKILGKVFYENSFLLSNEGWIITGNKLESSALHQTYSLQDKNCPVDMSRYITGKDDLINVDSKTKMIKTCGTLNRHPSK